MYMNEPNGFLECELDACLGFQAVLGITYRKKRLWSWSGQVATFFGEACAAS